MINLLKKESFIFILVILALLPVMVLRDFTPANELRYLSIADEALRNHTFFAFTNHGVAYADKPPFYLWLVMLLRSMLGSHEMWALSLLSLLPAGVIVHVMDRWTANELGETGRSVARTLLLTTGLFLGAALTVRMDMLMCMFIVLAMRAFWHIYKGDRDCRKQQWLFAIYTFMALFTKGPLGVLFPLGTSAVFLLCMREPHKLTKIFGWRTWAVLIGGCAVWWGLTYAEGGSEYLHNLLFHQTMDRAVNAFHHSRPFHFYLVCLWYCLAPWSVYAVVSLALSLRKNRNRSSLYTYFLISGLTILVILSCISSKLQVYMLPAVPFLMYAVALNFKDDASCGWCKVCIGIPAFIFVLAMPALIVYAEISGNTDIPLSVYVAAALLVAGGASSLRLLFSRRFKGRIPQASRSISLMGCFLFCAIFSGSFALADLGSDMGYRELSRKALEVSAANGHLDFTAWKMKNAPDMDVFLHQDVTELPDCETAADSIKRPTLLLAPTDKLPSLHLPREAAQTAASVGKYSILILK